MILNEMYHEAIDYAYKLSPNGADLVHDSFVSWYDKTKKNLFDEKKSTVIKEVKKTYWKKYGNKPRMVVFKDKFVYDETTVEDEYIEHENDPDFITFSEIEQEVEHYEQYHAMYPKIYLN